MRLATATERRIATAVLRTQPDIDLGGRESSSRLLDALTAHLRYLDNQEACRESAQ